MSFSMMTSVIKANFVSKAASQLSKLNNINTWEEIPIYNPHKLPWKNNNRIKLPKIRLESFMVWSRIFILKVKIYLWRDLRGLETALVW